MSKKQVDNILESHLQRVDQQSEPWLALGSHQELEEDQHVEQSDEDQVVAISSRGPEEHKMQLSKPKTVNLKS